MLRGVDLTTGDWIDGLARGDEACWERFFDELGPLLQAVGMRMGLSAEERDEVVQGAALRVLERLQGLRAPDSFASWVYGIGLRLALDLHRARRRRAEVESQAAASIQDAAWGDVPLEQLERLERIAELQDALVILGDRCRRLLTLLYFEVPAPSYRDIARDLGVPIGSIGPTRGRCLQSLLALLPDVSARGSRPSRMEAEAGGERKAKR